MFCQFSALTKSSTFSSLLGSTSYATTISPHLISAKFLWRVLAEPSSFNEEYSKKVYLPNYQKESFTLKKYDISSTLDLRGERVEEALDELEAYLDKASLANLSPVYIIHGHGTGALKSAVRDFVSTSPYVAKYRVGEEAEGGDGVCVIDIK